MTGVVETRVSLMWRLLVSSLRLGLEGELAQGTAKGMPHRRWVLGRLRRRLRRVRSRRYRGVGGNNLAFSYYLARN